jgi:hypothetical protein
MKLYNPFKPHFCQFGDGQFGMRKLSLAGWAYLDTSDMGFWLRAAYTGSRHTDLVALKRLVTDRTESTQRGKNKNKSRRVL